MSIGNLSQYDPAVKYGANIDAPADVSVADDLTVTDTLGVTGVTTLTGDVIHSTTATFTGVASFTAAPAFTAAPTGANTLRTIVDSAAVGATVVLTAAQCGTTFNNASTSGSPSWTLPTAAAGLWYTFTVSDVTTGFTITGGTMKFKTTATGTTLSGTTLTNTQGTAVVNDTITLVCDGTVWRMTSQSGIFAAS
jgi:hypothetical protein